jgi:succinate dehydrogenase / fumarate reductase flavoprotein subunit
MGGIPTDIDAQVVTGADETPVPGLYAAGECACVSVHGANRLGTNSLLDIVVFGRRGGAHMAAFAKDTELAPLPGEPVRQTLDMLNGLLSRDRSVNPADIRAELQDAMFDKAFVVRNQEGLSEMEDVLADLHDRYAQVGVQDKGSVYNTDLMEAVELGSCWIAPKRWSPRPRRAPRAAAPISARTIPSATTRAGSSTRWRTVGTTERSIWSTSR